MKYKLLATDLDGTLLNSNSEISQKNLEAINKFREAGGIFVVMTGRIRQTVGKFIEQLDYKELIGLYQGAVVIDMYNDNVVFKSPLQRTLCKEIYYDCVRRGLNVQVFDDTGCKVERYDEQILFYEKLCDTKVTLCDSLEPVVSNNSNIKLLINATDGEITKNYDFFVNKYGDKSSVVRSGKCFIEFTHKDATKGHALEYIASRYGVDRTQIIAVGDYVNDIPMIKFAGLGIAVENACDDAKKSARYIAPTNDNDAIAHIIEKFILNG